MQNNLSGQLQILKSQLEEVAIQIGDALMPTIKKIVEKIQDWVQKFSDLDEGTKEMIVKIGLVVAAIGPLLAVGGQITSGIGSIMSLVGKLFNVLAAHPLGAIAIAIGAVVAAGLAWAKWTEAQAQAEFGLNEEQKKLIETIFDERKAFDDLKETRDKQISASEGELTHLQALIDEYNEHIDANGNVQEGYENRANFILNTLAEAFGMERSEIDNLIDENGKLGQSIEDVMQKKRQDAYLSVYLDSYKEAMQKATEAQKNLRQATQDSRDANEKYKEALEHFQQASQNTSAGMVQYYAELYKAQQELKAAKEAQDKTSQAVEDAESTYQDYMSTIKNYEGYQEAVWANDTEGVEKWQARLKYDYKDLQESNADVLKQQEKDLNDTLAEMERDAREHGTEINEIEYNAVKQMRDDTHSQLEEWQKKSQEDAERELVAVAAGLADPSGQGKIRQAMIRNGTISKEGWDEAVKDINQHGQKAANDTAAGISSREGDVRAAAGSVGRAAESEMANSMSGTYQNGATRAGEFGTGISSQEGYVKGQAGHLGAAAQWEVDANIKNVGNSGKDFTSRFGSGIEGNAYQAENASRNTAQKAVNAASNTANGNSLLSAGKNLVYGLWNGLSSAGSWLWNQVTGWANNIIGGIKGMFGIASPSKVFRDQIGLNLGLGVGEGFKKSIPQVTRTMQDAAGKLTDNMQGYMDLPFSFAGSLPDMAGANMIAAAGGDHSTTTNMGGVTINITGSPGQDVNELADLVQRRIANLTARRQAVFS